MNAQRLDCLAWANEKQYSQCGGLYYTGSKACASPYTCVYSNPYYSQVRLPLLFLLATFLLHSQDLLTHHTVPITSTPRHHHFLERSYETTTKNIDRSSLKALLCVGRVNERTGQHWKPFCIYFPLLIHTSQAELNILYLQIHRIHSQVKSSNSVTPPTISSDTTAFMARIIYLITPEYPARVPTPPLCALHVAAK